MQNTNTNTNAGRLITTSKIFGVTLLGSLCLAFNTAADAQTKPAPAPKDTLEFYNVHTGESMTVTRKKGELISDRTNLFMRDYRRNEKANMSPQLFDLLGDLKKSIQKRYPNISVTFKVVSSYRTPQTNSALQRAGGTQADKSQHMLGKAMDIAVDGVPTKDLRDMATCLKRGGVGYYAEDQFVHVDVARVRYWPSHDYLKGLKCPKN
ncbi:MAG: DUF882 domain-containing protein [Micavibrio sp.]|nr:DUF882 domain-containing protein [Micavibrio sp.]